jgi:hypothetical protein
MSKSDDTKSVPKQPWGDAKAVIERGNKSIWLTLGPVWETDSGGLRFVLDVEPLAWRNPNTERAIVIVKRGTK